MTIPLRSRCLLVGPKTPDRLLGLECFVMSAIHITDTQSRYTVILNTGQLVRCGEAALFQVDPQPWQWDRVAGMKQTKGPAA